MSEETTLNDQIKDSIEQMQAMLADSSSAGNTRAFSYQLMAHSIGLAMYNTVQQQQQMYILQNAVTTAATKAILEASPQEALALAREGFGSQDILATLKELKQCMDDLHSTYHGAKEDVASSAKEVGDQKPTSAPNAPVKKTSKAAEKAAPKTKAAPRKAKSQATKK